MQTVNCRLQTGYKIQTADWVQNAEWQENYFLLQKVVTFDFNLPTVSRNYLINKMFAFLGNVLSCLSRNIHFKLSDKEQSILYTVLHVSFHSVLTSSAKSLYYKSRQTTLCVWLYVTYASGYAVWSHTFSVICPQSSFIFQRAERGKRAEAWAGKRERGAEVDPPRSCLRTLSSFRVLKNRRRLGTSQT